jgi:protein gp37
MGDKSAIEWTDATWNPVTGCTKVSQGCKHCYAERHAVRFWGDRKFTEVRCHPERLDQPLRWRRPRRVFVNSMSDLFHEDVPDEFIWQVFNVMQLSGEHIFQILSKRPARMYEFVSRRIRNAGHPPLPNVWLGVSCENQDTADERIPLLLRTLAAVRFVSAEPLLGPVNFEAIEWRGNMLYPLRGETMAHDGAMYRGGARLDWVIIGGESGPGARPFDVAWARHIIAQCKTAGVPVFMKQLGSNARGWCAWNTPEWIGDYEQLGKV